MPGRPVGLDRLDQRPAFFAGDVPGGEVGEAPAADGHEVAAHGPVVGPERDAHRRGLQRRSAGVIALGVVAEQAQRRDVAGRQEPIGHVPRAADDPFAGNPVHLGNFAAWSGVRPPSAANGSSAAPSGITMTNRVSLDMICSIPGF